MAAGHHNANSLETILTYENRDLSQWSVVWSTTHVPGMDNATGGGPRTRVAGRRRLRVGSLALGALLTMHCRVTASALTGGLFVFIIFLVLAVAILANPLRHFEVYLGQWSISGPGRAFRIIPMLDGIGIAICINAIVRAINCCVIAAITAIYVMHSVADAKLPFTYCRNFDLKTYEPVMKDFKSVMRLESRFATQTTIFEDDEDEIASPTVGLSPKAWRSLPFGETENVTKKDKPRQIAVCEESYHGEYPALYNTPAYNFFYVEVIQLREDYSLGQINITLVISIVCVWSIIWGLMISERIRYGKLIWNNICMYFLAIPWVWAALLTLSAASSFTTLHKHIKTAFRVGAKEIVTAIGDALEVALYIHSASVGTEIIHGKGLNHYASGHIDPSLNAENLWHSSLVLILSGLHSGGAALCALVDYIQPSSDGSAFNMRESTLWIIPMYSKCTSYGGHTHLMSTLIFGGLTFSYIFVAFVLLKSALHSIFEYRVKLVFVEQIVVGILILSCMGLSILFATNGGLALLESVDAMMTGVAVAFVCALELFGLLYVYRSHDFISDINVATEENVCSTRIGTQWQIIPYVTLVTLLMKSISVVNAEMPKVPMYIAAAPLAAVFLAVPLRACQNAFVFLRPNPRRGT